MIKSKFFKKRIALMLAAVLLAGVVPAGQNIVFADERDVQEYDFEPEERGIVFEDLDVAPWVPEDVLEGCGEDEAAAGSSAWEASSYVPEGIAGGSDPNYVTSVKNQSAYVLTVSSNGKVTAKKRVHPYETCWAFSSIGAMEINANLKASRSGRDLKTPDLSERAAVYYSYRNDFGSEDVRLRDPLATDKRRLGFLMKDSNILYIQDVDPTKPDIKAEVGQMFAFGGNPQFIMDTAAMGVGLADESAAPYSSSVSTNASDPAIRRNLEDVDPDAKYGSDYYLKSGHYISMQQKDVVKRNIIEYGAVTSTFNYSPSRLVSANVVRGGESSNEYLYHYAASTTNHSLLIVGWDDNLKWTVKDGETTQEITGAWLCKNSYGEDWEETSLKCPSDKGFFWVSYATTNAKVTASSGLVSRTGYTFEVERKDSGAGVVSNRLYEYDGSVRNKELELGNSYANIFTSADISGTDNNEYLRSVMVKLATPGSVYSVQLYENPGLNANKKFDPTTGTPLLSKPVWGEVAEAGYYSVDLGKGIRLNSSSKVAVVVNMYRRKVTDDAPTIYAGVSGSYKMTMPVDKDNNVFTPNSKGNVVGLLKGTNSSQDGCSYYQDVDGAWHDIKDEAAGAPRIKLRTVLMTSLEDYVAPEGMEVIPHYEKSPAKPELPDQPVITITSPKKQSGSTRLYVGQKAQIIVPDDEGTPVWTSSKEQYVTVDSHGFVTGIKKGKSKITARVGDTVYEHTVVVRKPFMVSKTIRTNVTESWTPLINGGRFQTIEWSSSKPAVAEINPITGRYKALKRGTAVITASMGSGRLRAKVIVPALKLKRTKMVMAPEAEERPIEFKTMLFSDPEFESSDENVAVVDEDGMVTAVGNGKAIITVRVEGTTLRCKITVKGFEE